MAKFKHYNYSQMVMIPVSLENQLMPGTLFHWMVANFLQTPQSRGTVRLKNSSINVINWKRMSEK